MKRTEIAMIILVASLSMLLTFTVAQSLLGQQINRTAKVEKAQAISKDLVQPSKRTFNSEAINPTVEVCVESNQSDGDEDTSTGGDCSSSEPSLDTETPTGDDEQTSSDPEQDTESQEETTN